MHLCHCLINTIQYRIIFKFNFSLPLCRNVLTIHYEHMTGHRDNLISLPALRVSSATYFSPLGLKYKYALVVVVGAKV